jgi:CubicO group peptidase (beta-lactamase class C family)
LPAPESIAAAFERDLRRTQADGRLPSVAAAVFSRGDVLWSDAVGVADVHAGVDATVEHQYRIGSITKTFTAAAVMQLRDAGEVDLEDPISRHLPDAAHGEPTIRRLLSHLSGLQREVPGEVWETMTFPDSEGLYEAYAESERVLDPGAHWHYSNLAFSLLGQVVERRSGTPYERYVEERLFRPVDLRRTTWEESQPAARGYFVEPYQDVVRNEPHVDLRAKRSAGQLWSTVNDLALWLSFLAQPDPAVLRVESAAEMRAFHGLADHERWTLGYGLGLELHRARDRILFGHTGGMPGFITAAFYSAADRVGATALTNGSHGGDVIDLAITLASRAAEALAPPAEEWRPAAAAPPEVADLVGSWWFESTEWVFTYRDGRLQARPRKAESWSPPAVFQPDGDDRYRTVSGPERGELLRVVRDDAGTPVKLYWATYPHTRAPRAFGG